jgi:hypothetical protein
MTVRSMVPGRCPGLKDFSHLMRGLYVHKEPPDWVKARLAGLAPAADKPPPVKARTLWRWQRPEVENMGTACHEAAHACAAHRVGCVVEWAGLDPAELPDVYGACTYSEPDGGLSRSDKLFVLTAGPAAGVMLKWRRVGKEELDGRCYGDLETARKQLGPVGDAEWGDAFFRAETWLGRNWGAITAIAHAILATPRACLEGEELRRLLASWHCLT